MDNSQNQSYGGNPGQQPNQTGRIDLNNYQPDMRKANELQRRLYDSGISHIPMPSVKRPIEDNISSRPFSARMNSSKIQSLSPLKKKIQDLNTQIISNLNESYKEAAIQEAKYQGEGTADYYRSQQIFIQQPPYVQPSKAGRKLQGRMGVSMGQPRMTGQLITNRKTAMQPLDPEFRQKMNDKLNHTVVDPSKIMAGPPSLVYAGFEGGASMSQKNLEQARSKFLLDKLTGKLPAQLRASGKHQLPPIDAQSQGVVSVDGTRKEKVSDVKPDVDYGQGDQVENEKKPQKWTDLDKYIELLLDSKSEEETVFVYLRPNENGDPYDLQVLNNYKERKSKYYTLSGKGLTLYENDSPVEFLSLGQWLIERDSYNHIKEKSFFKQFKKWKFMRMWKKTIKHQNRIKAQNHLDEKLFMLQPHFSKHLYDHRKLMIEMSQFNFVDICNTAETKTKDEFAEAQDAKRKQVEQQIKNASGKARENIKTCIKQVLSELRERIVQEITLDEERKKNNPVQTNTVSMKRKEQNNVFEKLGFPPGMTYGHKSNLRKECSKFLRFAYLADFLSLEALANIYTGSVKAMLDRLKELDLEANMVKIMTMEFDETNGGGQQQRGMEPLFHIDVVLQDARPLPEHEIVEVPIDDFQLPPRGTSAEEDFDVMTHIELEPEIDDDAIESSQEEGEDDDNIEQKYKKTTPNIQKFWIKLSPDEDDFTTLIQRTFSAGLESIQCFERWSKHGELHHYSQALEEWDDIVGGPWEEPDSLFLNPFSWISEHPIHQNKANEVQEILGGSYNKAQEFLKRFQPLLEIYWRNRQFDIDILVHERLKNSVETLSNTIKLFKYYQQHFQSNLPNKTDIGLLQLDSASIRSQLQPTPKEQYLDKIEAMVPNVNKNRTDIAKEWLNQSIKELKMPVNTVEDFVVQTGYLARISRDFQVYKDKVELYGQFYGVLAEASLNNRIKKEDKDSHGEAFQSISTLTNLIAETESAQESQNEKFKKDLAQQIPLLRKDIHDLHQESVLPQYLEENSNMDDMIKQLDAKKERFKSLEELAMKYNSWQEVLETPPTNFTDLDELRDDLFSRHLLWHSLQEWEELTEQWVKTNFGEIDAPTIEAASEKYDKIAKRLEKSLEVNPIQAKLKDLVDEFKGAMPIVTSLRNDKLTDAHWEQIREIVQNDIAISEPDFTLQSLLDLKVVQFQEEIVSISVKATGEHKLKVQLDELQNRWTKVEFKVKQYKEDKEGVYILVELDDLYNELDESLAAINMILGNRYVQVMRDKAEKLKKELNNLNNAVEGWVKCQRDWIYLENIFASPEIKRVLQNDTKMFESVNKFFTQLMVKTQKQPLPMKLTKNQPNLVEQLTQQNANLEIIQKNLDKYLETKRGIFPRFYFLSKDELLTILANSENYLVIQQFMKQLFDGLVKLEITDTDVTKMYSKEGECIDFTRAVKLKPAVEQWLVGVQDAMRDTIQKRLRDGQKNYNEVPRKEWCLKHPGQVIATVAQIQWCLMSEDAITEMLSDPLSLTNWSEQNDIQLKGLNDLVRSNLNFLERCIIVALITTDVHARDIVNALKDQNVSSTYDFEWQKQLRYYWDEESDMCVIRQIQAMLKYGLEYMGATSRLVITPLTDKCWITITGALHIKLGANPSGPAGTGKTESTKDLAKAIATLCIVFNCSDQVDYQMMYRLFSGLAQQGAWTCLDEFNRIETEVLSVIAQQLLQIRKALLANNPQGEPFQFDDCAIPLKHEFGCHITMNPGYAGRTELPDNLKVLFRPVAMMIPNYGLIAEIMLSAEGFAESSILSKKMVQLYKLSSEQLSKQDHYDFGMRAVKSVLVMAGDLRRKADPSTGEDAVLIRAMQDANIPKFLKDDLPLFNAIVQDLFPGTEIPQADYTELLKQISRSIRSMKLQTHESFMMKVIQLYETFKVRFGVMLVGPTGGGKTTCYEVLANVMIKFREMHHPNPDFQKVIINIINPKAISMDELYGKVDLLSQEWTDGLASKIMRSAANETSDDKSWTVFDGPVDALWIENMNTVLDDNMTLCLSNGQRIKLRNQMNMLFEVQDLEVASPATVSRCGMVYIADEDLGWRPYVKTWIEKQYPDDDILDQELKDFLWETFDATIDMALDRIRNGGQFKEPIVTDNLQQVRGLTNFLEVFLTEQKGFKGDNKQKRKDLEAIFAWSFTWGIGASLDERSKDFFDTVVKDSFKAVPFPPQFTVFDYFYDLRKDKMFKPWDIRVDNFVFDKTKPYFELMVPTAETYKHRYCLELLLSIEKASFFTGETGTGKSIIVQNTLDIAAEGIIQPVYINFSAQTSSERTQSSIIEKLDKTSRSSYGASPGKKIAIFVDDINMPAMQTYGAQAPIELLRLYIDKKGLYDREEWQWKNIKDSTLVAAAAPPSGARAKLTPRFTTHFNMFCLPQASQALLSKIFGGILDGFLKSGFGEAIQGQSENVIQSTIEIYQRISEELRATPSKFHYLFNLRDVSKVIQGILMSKPVSIVTPDSMHKLWVNEVSRVFYDRLNSVNDKEWFIEVVMELLQRSFRSNMERDDIFGEKKVMFGDLLTLDSPVRKYEEFKDKSKLLKQLNSYLEEYNIGSSNKMNLVFFEDAVLHTLRICRTLRQPRGNIMLIGVGGSGKQSLIRLSAYMYEMEFRQIEITKDYGSRLFQEFVKGLMFDAGIDGKKLAFTMTDSQILEESFLEDVNNVLNTGEIPNLMQEEDKGKIISDVRPVVIEMKKVDTVDTIEQVFTQRVRENLHICLCMSPVGDDLRIRCRQFPSLVNCCTLDWFDKWPREALLYVSSEFLKELTLPSQEMRDNLSEMCMLIHTTVDEASQRYYDQLRRHVYTTPKSYLDLINLYINRLEQKRSEFNANKNRLATGLKKLNDTNASIAELKVKLKEMQPILLENNEKLKETLVISNKEKLEADEKERVVMGEKEIVEKKAQEAGAIRNEAAAGLAEAQPELDAAKVAVNTLDVKHIQTLKVLQSPPADVELCMDSIMVLLQEKPGWQNVLKTIKYPDKFKAKLQSFKIENLPETVLTKVRNKYFKQPSYTAEIMKTKAEAAGALCTWALALAKYQVVWKKIVPKQKKLAEVQGVLASAQAELDIKLAEVNKVKQKVADLMATIKKMQENKADLEFNMNRSENRMRRAEKLVVLLADEGIRWKESVGSLSLAIDQLVGDVFLSCACISYFGAFDGSYRKTLTEGWLKACHEKKIPTCDQFNLVKTMGDSVIVRGWNIQGLPTDNTSSENGILVTQAERWGLCIDPQQQANKWIKNMMSNQDLLIGKFGKKNFLRDITGCVRNGKPVLIEDVEKDIDPAIDPLLLHQEFMSEGNIKQIRIGDGTVDYEDGFKLFMTTKDPNPHYKPEVCIKVTLINFTVTFQGLEEQLLGDVVIQEKPEVEQQRDQIVVQMDADQRTLKDIEVKILKLLSESTEEQILDEDTLISILESSKITSSEINERIGQAKIVEEDINVTRAMYKSVAIRGSIMYFVIADLPKVNDMYQNSLQFVKSLFNKAIEMTPENQDADVRIQSLIEVISKTIFTNISRGLFEEDKLIFSFLITTSIGRNSGLIDFMAWNMLLRGAMPITPDDQAKQPPNPLPDVLSELNNDLLYSAEINCKEAFTGLFDSFSENQDAWTTWAKSDDPQSDSLPDEWDEKLSDFEKLLLLKAFRAERLMFAFQNYVLKHMGKFYVESQSVTMELLYADTDFKTPLIFILSPGADPTAQLHKFAEEMGYTGDRSLGEISLGQGQGERALRLVKDSSKEGLWVMLKNCHLSERFMPDMEKMVLDLALTDGISPDFRLFLTSMPAPFFPTSVLQNGVKLTTEPPRGLKANLKRTYIDFNDSFIDSCKKPEIWKKMLFGLSFMHAIVQERRKFGPLGWNTKYEFNDSDLETSHTMLKLFLDEQDEIPWQALVYVTGKINYGGRVTDEFDLRCLLATLQKYYCPENLEDGYYYSDSQLYFAPPNGNIDVYRNYIDQLPLQDSPEVFGLHENANIAYQKQESDHIVDVILSIQPRVATAGGGLTPDEIVLLRAQEIAESIPDDLAREEGKKELFKIVNGLLPSLTVVLLQEMEKFNRLLRVMRKSLKDLQDAIHGLTIMSEQLDTMKLKLQNGQVPPNWEEVGYKSLKPLALWFQDLIVRVKMMEDWLTQGNPITYWMSGLFFPQGFLTGCLQTHARNYKIAIDKLSFSFVVQEQEDPSEIDEAPTDGVFIHGLFMDGARWNHDEMVIDDQIPGQLYSKMPIIWFKPFENYEPDVESYQCPCYKTGDRKGTLSTTGQSTNFIIEIQLPTNGETNPSTWVRRAAAILCQLSD